MSQTADPGGRNGMGLPPAAPGSSGRRVDRLSLVVGVLFVLAGVLFLLDVLDVWRLRVDYLVPLALIVLGLVVLASAWPLRSRRP
ncbi:MAG: LiaI-LiaF-like domain-containing protein [Actinomycetes bacterium]